MIPRFLKIIACALLVFDLSGGTVLIADEGCRPAATDGAHDTCSPSCLRCVCCVQPVIPPPVVSAAVLSIVCTSCVVPLIITAAPGPAKIFHVPRSI